MLPDDFEKVSGEEWDTVSMHLMVLGASRLSDDLFATAKDLSLNAPDGAGCFPTYVVELRCRAAHLVSMHLMVLGASRPDVGSLETGGFNRSQCT